eukprot:COSAG02_NODE_14675_length_1249_cov_1.347826_1_plen_123_part_00
MNQFVLKAPFLTNSSVAWRIGPGLPVPRPSQAPIYKSISSCKDIALAHVWPTTVANRRRSTVLRTCKTRTMFGCFAFGAGGFGGGKGGSGGGPGSGGTLAPEILSSPMIMTAIGAMAQVASF